MSQRSSMSRWPLALYTGLVSAAGVIVFGFTLSITPLHELLGSEPRLFFTFGVLLLATEAKPMVSPVDSSEVTASWTFAFALLFVAPLAGCLAVVVACAVVVDLARGKSVGRAVFNAAQFALSLSAGVWAGSLIAPLAFNPDTSTTRWLVAGGVAGVLAFGLNSLLISIVVSLHGGLPVVEMLRRSFSLNLTMDGALLALAPIFVVVGTVAWALVLLLLVTVWTIFRSATIALTNRHEATHDLLTGIANRRLFDDRAALLLAGAAKSHNQAGLIHLDLDGFKGVNDRLGHHYGDLVLKEVARRLNDHRRPMDHVARLGGDEFAVLLGRLDNPGTAVEVAHRLLAAIEAPMVAEGVPLGISASLGISIYPDHGEDLTTLMRHADAATYQAKESAITNVVLWTPDPDTITPGKLSLLADLGEAIEQNQLHLVFQPQVNLQTGALTGVEALLRWHHPTHGTISPGRFVRQAEQTGLINQLTDRVLHLAISQCATWHAAGAQIRVAINISVRNLHDLRFPARVAEVLAAHHVDPMWIEIEITENAVMADPARTSSVLRQLRAIGVSIAIDDFGTGYSSLANLRTLTVDAIKIDRIFISEMLTRSDDLAIARSIIQLGHQLGLRVIAEGVETSETLQLLRQLDCDEAQGYLLAVPQSASELEALVQRGKVDFEKLEPALH